MVGWLVNHLSTVCCSDKTGRLLNQIACTGHRTKLFSRVLLFSGCCKHQVSEMAGVKKKMCKYGSKCYRRNPQHLREYSHPDEKVDPMLREWPIESGIDLESFHQ